ncbi:hypothetical protein OIU74_028062 [Salix koriyanagi]|uniref:Uncharacterized protein n=1 Tax=Salix koriyanagi TaxID=2511006 RepID=A0A9Q0VCW3_9ROSI|nr:hypothetical protein OIU74_028062 [Salix koriyanagi]
MIYLKGALLTRCRLQLLRTLAASLLSLPSSCRPPYPMLFGRGSFLEILNLFYPLPLMVLDCGHPRLPKKELYFSLCENPVLVDNGRKSFSLEKKSGKKCCRLSARDLLITWGDAPRYWTWYSDPASRFPEVAELISVCWLEIRAKINTSMLSPTTLHTAYLVLKFSRDTYCDGLDDQPVEVAMKLDGEESCTRTVSWNAERRWGAGIP